MARPLPKSILQPRAAVPQKAEKTISPGIHLGGELYWEPAKTPNPHMVILGTSGSGKTQTLKAIAWEMLHKLSSRSIVLDFHGDQQLPGEACYPLHMASPHGINPLIINPDPAGEKRQQVEFEYQLKQNEHVGQVQRLELEWVKLLETGRLQEHDREYQIAQLVLKGIYGGSDAQQSRAIQISDLVVKVAKTRERVQQLVLKSVVLARE